MKEIEAAFSKYFSHWGIRLPAEAIEGKQRGKIIKQGWAIWYVFGSDEKGWYLDYYAAHRMTDDRHVRIRADGSCESLETLSSMRLCSEDPKQDAQWEAEFVSTNRRIAEMLEEKGFGLEGR